ncbi:MAG: HD domain-containing phosphohydrolase [Pyrinomonadaceae bacterium]
MLNIIESEKNLLIIEQDSEKRSLLKTFLSGKYLCDEADSINSAIARIQQKEYSVVLLPCNLPEMDGIELIAYVQKISPRTVPILFSDNKADGKTVRAFRAGAFEVIQMPFSLKKVESAVKLAFAQYEAVYLKDNYRNHLEELVASRTAELDKALEEIENSYRMTLKALIQALETRDFETHGHSERVVTFSLRLGHELGLEKEALRDLELGALLHDIGKIGVPDAILRKPAKLTEDEWTKMKLHPLHGQRILRNIEFLEGAARIVAQHHEKWDGSGYPLGLRGEDIDLGARIFAVVDAFDAMISNRVYRRGCSYKEAVAELERCAGTQFDPMIVEAFKNIPREDWEVLYQRSLKDKQDIHSFQSVVSELVHSQQVLEMVH